MPPTTCRLPVRQPQLQVPNPALQPRAAPGKVFIRSNLWKVWNQDDIDSEAESNLTLRNPISSTEETPLPGLPGFEDEDMNEEDLSRTQTRYRDEGLSREGIMSLENQGTPETYITYSHTDDEFPQEGSLDPEYFYMNEQGLLQSQARPENQDHYVYGLSLEGLIRLRESSETDEAFLGAVDTSIMQSQQVTGGLSDNPEENQDESTHESPGSVPIIPEISSMHNSQEPVTNDAVHIHDDLGESVNPSPLWSPCLVHLLPAFFYHGRRVCTCAPSEEELPEDEFF